MAETTWRKLIAEEAALHGESLSDMISITLSDHELDIPFDDGYGGAEGLAFTAWSEMRVYFPAVYDGSEWCASVPRHPGGGVTGHIGGQ